MTFLEDVFVLQDLQEDNVNKVIIYAIKDNLYSEVIFLQLF